LQTARAVYETQCKSSVCFQSMSMTSSHWYFST